MKTVTMTELNQQVSSITRLVVDRGVPVQVTKHGRPVMTLVPEVPESAGPVEALIAAGLASPPTRRRRSWRGVERVRLSRPLDDLLDETRADADV